MKRRNKLYLPVLVLLLSACATQSVPPAEIYTLSPAWQDNTVPPEIHTNRLDLKLVPVNTTRIYDTTDMVYTDSEYTRNHYAYSRWVDTPVALLQTLFQVALEKSNHFDTIIPPVSSSKTDLLLESTLFDFSHHIEADGSSSGVIRIRFYLINDASKKIIASKQFSASIPAPQSNAHGAAIALNQAAVEITHDLVHWLVSTRHH